MNETRMRVGLGHDRHRLVSGRRLILGGVTIDYEMGLDGHSDADVLLHAVTDALLGAAGLGDIGEWFPNTDPRWANVDSAIFLQQALREVQNRGWKIVNLDCTIHAERPKLSAYKKPIAHQIALLLNLDPSQVNVKAKTGERVGPVGRQEAIDADAIVLLAGADDPARDAGSVRQVEIVVEIVAGDADSGSVDSLSGVSAIFAFSFRSESARGRASSPRRPNSSRNCRVVSYRNGRPSVSSSPPIRTRPRSMRYFSMSVHWTRRIVSMSARVTGCR